jgi:hypothetical protein
LTIGLNNIQKNIEFAEELIATGFAIKQMEIATLPGGMWEGCQEELDSIKNQVLGEDEYKEIKPLIDFMCDKPKYGAMLIPFLEPVKKFSFDQIQPGQPIVPEICLDGVYDALDARESLNTMLDTLVRKGLDIAQPEASRIRQMNQELLS